MALNTVDICAGYGGLGLGVRLAVPDARTVLYVEREAASVEVLEARMREGHLDRAPVWSDLCTLDGRPWAGVVDLVTAGIPCQPWSTAGKRKGFDDERHLGEELVRVVGEMGPSLVFVENVRGFVRLGAPDLLGRLADLGFDAEWGVFSSAGVGAPHRRERVFLLAHREDVAHRDNTGQSAGGRAVRDQRDDAGWGGAPDVADSASERAGRGERDLREADGRPGRALPREFGESGQEVADTDGRRLQGERLEGCPRLEGARRDEPDRRRDDGGFPWARPPGPGADWSGIPEWCHPATTQPDVRGVADGSPSRVDRLRMLGNGVDPLVGAYAFRTLARRAGVMP